MAKPYSLGSVRISGHSGPMGHPGTVACRPTVPTVDCRRPEQPRDLDALRLRVQPDHLSGQPVGPAPMLKSRDRPTRAPDSRGWGLTDKPVCWQSPLFLSPVTATYSRGLIDRCWGLPERLWGYPRGITDRALLIESTILLLACSVNPHAISPCESRDCRSTLRRLMQDW